MMAALGALLLGVAMWCVVGFSAAEILARTSNQNHDGGGQMEGFFVIGGMGGVVGALLGAWIVWRLLANPARTGAVGAGMFLLLVALAGAIAFAATTLPQVQVLVGASGGIAALTGAAVRFIFQPPVVQVDPDTGERKIIGRHLATLGEFVRQPTARFFSLTWLVLNGLVPIVPQLTGGGMAIAWQAHIGGFLAGLLLVPLLERRLH